MALLLVLSCCSLFVGVIDLTPGELLAGNFEQLEIFIISRLPRLLAILCTGIGMSVAGLIMQQLCSNKFVSPTTGATISSAQFGILLALLFMPASTLWSRAIFAFATAILGTWIFVWFIQRIQFKDGVGKAAPVPRFSPSAKTLVRRMSAAPPCGAPIPNANAFEIFLIRYFLFTLH